jgi:phosphoribosylaminoimidazolecarboxamide formyltransferase / IMP cyclohydrolase
VLGLLAAKKNLRVMRIAELARLEGWADRRFLEFKALADGGLIAQWSFVSAIRAAGDFKPASSEHKGRLYRVERQPDPAELEDMLFGWLVETGVTSNSVIYVKDGITVGIGTGEQDRVGVAEIARDKAYKRLADRLAWERSRTPFAGLQDKELKRDIEAEVARRRGGLAGSVMISDA